MKIEDYNVVMEIYERMFKEATPSADIWQIIKSGEGKKEGFFNKYYLEQDRQNEIIKEVIAKHKIRRGHRQTRIEVSVLLGSSPIGNREAWMLQNTPNGKAKGKTKRKK